MTCTKLFLIPKKVIPRAIVMKETVTYLIFPKI